MNNIVKIREFSEQAESEINLLHSPFYPAEVYEGDPISALLSLESGLQGIDEKRNHPFRVWRLSPLGVELLVEKQHEPLMRDLLPGSRVELQVKIGKHFCDFSGLVVVSLHQEKGRQLVGIRWVSGSESLRDSSQPREERRRSERWLCGMDFLPTGIAPNPVRFNDFIHFRVRDLSLDGMQLYTSLRNKHLIPGMVLDSVISLPMTGDVKFRLKIANTRILSLDGRDYLTLGTSILHHDDKIRATLGQYIFQFGPKTSVQELKKRGFRIASPSSAMEFGFVRSAEEYQQVLALRKSAYAAVGKMNADGASEQAGDIYDSRARILTARYRGELVASARIMFHSPEDRYEHEQFVEFTDKLPRKDEMVELTRICTHPEYRGGDLFYGIIRHISLVVAQSNRSWILGSAEPKLVGAYTRLGYQRTGVTFEHQDLGGVPHEILVGNIQKMLSGQGVSVSLWNELYSDLSYYLKDREMVDFDPFMNLRMNAYRSLYPLTRLMTRAIRKPRKK